MLHQVLIHDIHNHPLTALQWSEHVENEAIWSRQCLEREAVETFVTTVYIALRDVRTSGTSNLDFRPVQKMQHIDPIVLHT